MDETLYLKEWYNTHRRNYEKYITAVCLCNGWALGNRRFCQYYGRMQGQKRPWDNRKVS